MEFEKLSFESLLAAFASDAPTPGGGTAAALSAAMGAALAEMVAALTLSKEKYAASHDAVRPIAGAARRARQEFLWLAREDSQAYESVVAARGLPRETDAQKAARARRVAEANRLAAEVPMRTARAAVPAVNRGGSRRALLLEAAAQGALLNVGINLAGTDDRDFVATMKAESETTAREATRLRERVLGTVRKAF